MKNCCSNFIYEINGKWNLKWWSSYTVGLWHLWMIWFPLWKIASWQLTRWDSWRCHRRAWGLIGWIAGQRGYWPGSLGTPSGLRGVQALLWTSRVWVGVGPDSSDLAHKTIDKHTVDNVLVWVPWWEHCAQGNSLELCCPTLAKGSKWQKWHFLWNSKMCLSFSLTSMEYHDALPNFSLSRISV